MVWHLRECTRSEGTRGERRTGYERRGLEGTRLSSQWRQRNTGSRGGQSAKSDMHEPSKLDNDPRMLLKKQREAAMRGAAYEYRGDGNSTRSAVQHVFFFLSRAVSGQKREKNSRMNHGSVIYSLIHHLFVNHIVHRRSA